MTTKETVANAAAAPFSNAFTEAQLAKHWNISPKTLQAWRLNGGGPKFIKLGKAVRYSLTNVAEFEAANTRETTSSSAA